MSVVRYRPKSLNPASGSDASPAAQVAAVYDGAGQDYAAYADGDTARLFSFDGIHGYADRQIWLVLDNKLTELRTQGATSIRLLDAGCGPGTWLRRMVVRALDLGFTSVTARGFDIARSQIEQARSLSRDLCQSRGVGLTFEVADLTEPLPEPQAFVDITLCLYSVLSHLHARNLPDVLRELARVTSGHLVASVRSVGSVPSAFAYPIESIRNLRQDNYRNECEIELQDGSRTTFSLHLFTASELRSCVATDFSIEQLRGLDLFHTRFAPDPRWSPLCPESDKQLADELARLEESYAQRAAFIDRATHIPLVGRSETRRDTHAARGF